MVEERPGANIVSLFLACRDESDALEGRIGALKRRATSVRSSATLLRGEIVRRSYLATCPACGAEPERPCTDLRSQFSSHENKWPHWQRIAVYAESVGLPAEMIDENTLYGPDIKVQEALLAVDSIREVETWLRDLTGHGVAFRPADDWTVEAYVFADGRYSARGHTITDACHLLAEQRGEIMRAFGGA